MSGSKPEGNRMLSNKVSEIMSKQHTTAPVSMSTFEVMEIMASADVGRVMVTDKGIPVGIFTEKDVVKRVIHAGLDARKVSVREVMTAPIQTVSEETHIIEALGKMYQGKYRHLLVRGRHGKIVGIVSMRRILGLAVELGQGLKESRTVGEVIAEGTVTVDQSASVAEIVKLMIDKNAVAVIVTSERKPVGIFTERDVLKRVATKEIDTKVRHVKEFMTSPLITMSRKALIGEVLTEMYRHDIRNMPITNDIKQLIGIMSMSDILQYAKALDIDESVRKSWKEVQEYLDSTDEYTPG
jgi:CBS domain-containing protein